MDEILENIKGSALKLIEKIDERKAGTHENSLSIMTLLLMIQTHIGEAVFFAWANPGWYRKRRKKQSSHGSWQQLKLAILTKKNISNN